MSLGNEKNNCVLAALDFNNISDLAVTQRAVEVARQSGAELELIHAVEHINAYGAAYAYPAVADLETKLVDEAKERLANLAEQLGVPKERQHVEFGSPKSAILRKAKQLKAKMIVVGSHGRHGLEFLMGSAANAILDNAPCDVLAVHLD